MLQFKADYKGFTLVIINGQFVIAELSERYSTEDQAIVRIDKYELSCRKNFSNSKAHHFCGFYRNPEDAFEEVEVTSVDGEYAWVKKNGSRRKEPITSLFPIESDAHIKALQSLKELDKQKTDIWQSVPRWKPEPKE